MISFFKQLEHSLWKATRKRDKRLAKARADRHAKLERALQSDKLRRDVFVRDKAHCRVCGTAVLLYSADDFKVGHAHHLTYRSAGGADTLANLALLCLTCHALEHEHILDIQGNGNETLTVTRYDPETRAVVDVRESPCP